MYYINMVAGAEKFTVETFGFLEKSVYSTKILIIYFLFL